MIANDVKARREVAIRRQELEDENIRLRHELQDKFRPENIIGNSSSMRDVYQQIHQVAGSDTTVLIRGESGTGKELVAHAIHYSSPRSEGPFIKVNCAALNENLLESELFGHEKGAFTGAIQSRKGRLEEANGGTLFLDEIGDFSSVTQVKLLRVLQERQFERVGSNQTVKTNARIVVATNRNLEKAVDEGGFRQDLYYRINVFEVFLPPLRRRKEDIPLLVDVFVKEFNRTFNKKIKGVSKVTLAQLQKHDWPGNIRELKSLMKKTISVVGRDIIWLEDLPFRIELMDEAIEDLPKEHFSLKRAEKAHILKVLKHTSWNKARAANLLEISRPTLDKKIKMYSLEEESSESEEY